jgi:hypothetical protein
MTSSRKRLGLQPKLLDSSSSSSQLRVLRILLFGQRARRRPAGEVGKGPSLGPHHREERGATAVDRGET